MIYHDGNLVESQYSVSANSMTGFYNLTISNIQVNNSGWYICVEDEGIGQKHVIRLVVTTGELV